jgi:murein DD-endopeptidase MepM/ murein hydrolase activator NlpD
MSEVTRMVIDDPEKIHILIADMKKQIIKAATETVNITARIAQKEARKNLDNNFILRNTFSSRQVQFIPMSESPYIKLSAIQSIVSVTEKAPWLKRQEEGGEHEPSKGKTLAIPTDIARGGSERKPVSVATQVPKLKKKKVHRVGQKGSSHQENKELFIARVAKAYENKLFIPMGGSKDQRNLHIITNFKSVEDNVTFKSKQVYKFDQKSTKTEAKPWFEPACEKAAKEIEGIFASQMKKLGL